MAGLMRAKLLKLSGELKSSIVPGIRWIHAVLDKHLKCLVVGDGRNNSLYSDNWYAKWFHIHGCLQFLYAFLWEIWKNAPYFDTPSEKCLTF